jgi:hypothetical protein
MPMQTAQYWEANAVDAEDVARAMAHSPDSFRMLEIARLYRRRAEQTRKLGTAGVNETLTHLRLDSGIWPVP